MKNEKYSLKELSENLKIKTKLDDVLLDSIEGKLFDEVIAKYVASSYLSHWRSTVESLVLEKRQAHFEKQIKLYKKSNENEDKDSILDDNIISIVRQSLYKIIILEDKDLGIHAAISTDEMNFQDIIYVNKNMNDKEKRCAIAHELGHIIINRIFKEYDILCKNEVYEKEELATLFACHILQDKSNFYKKKAHEYINTPDEIKTIIENIKKDYIN